MSRRGSRKTKKQKQEEAINWSRQQRLLNPKSKTSTSTSISENDRTRFFGCYLLTSLSPRFKGHSYIGFTVNPKRRIRQHNGEITSGAFSTKKKRPWEMVLCIHGFPTNVAALKFEWAWQHPRESVAVREAAASFKTLGGLASKIKLALTMLTLHSWQSMDLTVSFFSTKYMKHAAGCPSLPPQMKLHFCSMDELPCYGDSHHLYGHDDEDDFDSNDNEVSANYCSDDRIESSPDGSMEINPSSLEHCTIQKSSDNIFEGDCIGIGGMSENESFSMMDTLEERLQSLYDHQLPVDGSDSALHTSNEEFWFEESRGYFPVLEEDVQPIGGVHISEEDLFPALEEKHFPADVSTSSGNYLNEHSRAGKETGHEELIGSFPIVDEHVQSLPQTSASDREQTSMVGCFLVVDDTEEKDNMTCIVIDDITEEVIQPVKEQAPKRFTNISRPYSNEGIEIIELCTPSPNVGVTTGSKKKRGARDFPDIIDLTRSPCFVQL